MNRPNTKTDRATGPTDTGRTVSLSSTGTSPTTARSTEQVVAQPTAPDLPLGVLPEAAPRSRGFFQGLRRALLFVVALGIVAATWEAYKAIGPADGGDVFGWRIIPKTNDRVMPHTWEMLAEFGEAEVRGQDTPVWQAMLGYGWYTLRMSVAGLLLGTGLGMGLAIAMARYRVVERGLLPYVIISQTIPLIALAPQVASLGGNWDLPKWTWAASLAAFLSFFPVTIATLRGLQSAPAASIELMDSFAASWWTTLRKLRFPAAVPYIVPGLKLAATASVIGVVVSEVSLGLRGVGFAALNYGQKTTSQPATVYTAVIAAAILGLVLFGLVTAAESFVMRRRPREST